jgi:TonB family protein
MKHSVTILGLGLILASHLSLAQSANSNANRAHEPVYSLKEVDKKLVIKEPRPEPNYTRAACEKDIRGHVLLQAVLTSDGKVDDIEVLQGLPEGLTEGAIEAARRIKFKPAVKNGRPVSVRLKLEYNFFSEAPPPRCPDK